MKKKIKPDMKFILWLMSGFVLGLFFILSFLYIIFEQTYKEKIYPGVQIAGISFSGKTKQEVASYFNKKNYQFENIQFVFTFQDQSAIILARDLKFGYNSRLLAEQAVSIGRSADHIANLSIKIQALYKGLGLSPSYAFSEEALEEMLEPVAKKINIKPIEALFSFQPAPGGGKVVAFRPSSDGQEIDMTSLKKDLYDKLSEIVSDNQVSQVTINIALPVVIKKAKIQTSDVNKFGIKELIGMGTSRFTGSIANRVHNIQLAASRINGILVAPGETFSFNQILGDVSKFTGYKEAFIIQGGKTILGDGGGVCQVSTTLFRAILASGLPVVERHAHSYRVGYYEQDSGPGFDATVYAPRVDLKFKNDTQNHILIQAYTNPAGSSLTFYLYGTSDNRKTIIGKPVITNQKPAPEAVYNDDPSLPKGTVKQIDFAAAGASVVFTRTVEKDGQILISDKFNSNFQPWQAVYLRGTKE